MKNNYWNKIVSLIIYPVFLLFGKINYVFAQLESSVDLEAQNEALRGAAGFSANATIGSSVAIIIKAFLGLLGIIFVFLMVYAGYHWMTAAGDEQKVTKAKDTLRTAIIGLIIIVAAYSITYFVLKALGSSAGVGGGSMSTGG